MMPSDSQHDSQAGEQRRTNADNLGLLTAMPEAKRASVDDFER